MRPLTYRTASGILVTRRATKAPYGRGLKHLLRKLDSYPGIYLSSGYEYPERYSRWDIAAVCPPIEIVGIAGDVRHAALSAMPGPEIYLTHAQEPQGALTLVVRTAGDPLRAAASVRDQIRALDRDLPVSQMRTMEEVLSDSVGRPRFDAVLLGVAVPVAVSVAMRTTLGSVSRTSASIPARRAASLIGIS